MSWVGWDCESAMWVVSVSRTHEVGWGECESVMWVVNVSRTHEVG